MPDPPQSRFPTLTILLGLSGWAALGFSTYTKLIPTAAAAIGAIIWTALVGLTSKIWSRVEKTAVELIGDWLDIHIRDFASRYRKRYLDHLQHRHRTFDVKGLSTQGIYALEIEQVYVELTVNPRQAAEASPDPIAKPAPGGRHDIWTLLNSPQNLVPGAVRGRGRVYDRHCPFSKRRKAQRCGLLVASRTASAGTLIVYSPRPPWARELLTRCGACSTGRPSGERD